MDVGPLPRELAASKRDSNALVEDAIATAKANGLVQEPSKDVAAEMRRLDRAYAKTLDGLRLLPDAAPTEEVQPDPPSGARPPPQHTQVRIDHGVGGGTSTYEADLKRFGADPTGAALIAGAAYECGMGSALNTQWASLSTVYPQAQQFPYLPTSLGWIYHNGGVFGTFASNCETQLHQEQMLVCMADRLVAVANGLGPVVWRNVTVNNGLPDGPWVIPPAREQDRFIARDQALLLLSHITYLESQNPWQNLLPGLSASLRTCDQIASYALSTKDQSAYNFVAPLLFGMADSSQSVPFIPPELPRTFENRGKLIEARMKLRAQIRRAAGRLLRDELVSKSVYADLAGAFQQRNYATDPKRGLELMWGVADDVDPSFNTFRHAISVLAGRVLGPSDQFGGTVAPGDLLLSYGDTLRSRTSDVAIPTKGAEIAANLVEAGGILLDPAADATRLRSAIVAQLTETAARSNGITVPSNDYNVFKDASSVPQTLERVSDEDIHFAVGRALRAYHQLSSKSSIDPSDLGVGFQSATHVSSEITSLGGAVLSTALPRGDLAGDITARAGGILFDSVSFGAPNSGLNPQQDLTVVGGGQYLSYQDVFAMGEELQRLLSAQQGELLAAGYAEDDELVKTTQAGAAELRSWTGPGKVVLQVDPGTRRVSFGLLGFEWKDLGLTGIDDVSEGLAVVYGTAAVADCAAGIRETCPDDLQAQYVARPEKPSLLSGIGDQLRILGTSAPVILFTVTSGTPAGFALPQFVPTEQDEAGWYGSKDQFLYLIARGTPATKSRGRVLGAARVYYDAKPRAFIVSDLRRELLNNVLGVSDSIATRGSSRGGSTTADPKGYCIEGVPRDAFVPLENELTENSDAYENSWRHYLERAKDTAARADQIADQLLNLELQAANHKEAAQERLGQLCGAYGNLADLDFSSGQAACAEDAADSPLCACVNEDVWDLVFMSDDPTPTLCPVDGIREGEQAASQTACLKREILGCHALSPPPPADVPPNHPLCGKRILSHTGLKLLPFQDQKPALPEDCAQIAREMAGLQGDGLETSRIINLGNQEWRESDSIEATVGAMRFKLGFDGHWSVTVGGHQVMDSHPNAELWPGCLENPGPGMPCDPLADNSQATLTFYDRLFRDESARQAGTYDAAQKQKIMWRVQGALWVLAGLNTSAPDGYMELPIPAVDFKAAGASYGAPPLTVFGESEFSLGSTGKTLDQASGPEGLVDFKDVGIMNAATSEDERLAQPIPSTRFDYDKAQPRLGWIDEVYAHRENYLHVMAPTKTRKNFDINKSFRDWEKQLKEIFSGLPGAKCTDLETGNGVPKGDTATAKTLRDIAELKVGDWYGDPPTSLWQFHVCDGNIGGTVMFPDVQVQGGSDYSAGSPALGKVTVFDELVRDRKSDPYITSAPDYYQIGGPLMTEYPPLTVPQTPFSFSGPYEHEPCDGQPTYLTKPCARNRGTSDLLSGTRFSLSRQALRPAACSPQNRAFLYTNFLPPKTRCGGASQFVQAMGLACLVGQGRAAPPATLLAPPPLKSTSDIPAMSQWIRGISGQSKDLVRRIYFDSVPKRALEPATGQASDTLRGTKGEDLIAIGSKISQMKDNWSLLSQTLDGLAIKYDGLNIDITALHLDHESAEERLAMSRIQAHKELLADTATAIQHATSVTHIIQEGQVVPVLGWIDFAAMATNDLGQIYFDAQQLSLISDMEKTQQKIKNTAIQGVMNDFTLDIRGDFGTLQRSANQIDDTTRATLGAIGAIAGDQEQVQYEVAQATGATEFTNDQGEKVDLPVNKALSEQYNVYHKRYDNALNQARYLAYFARLAIEQRIGMRLNSIQTTIGNLEAPAIWADDVCYAKGKDYSDDPGFNFDFDDGLFHSYQPTDEYLQKLSDATKRYIEKDRSLMFIGDYVNQLENFVSFYNVEFPSKDADDQAVLSLVHDLLPKGSSSCTDHAVNLLYYSGNLGTSSAPEDDIAGARHGWQTVRCDAESRCLDVLPGSSVRANSTETVPSGLAGPGGSRSGHVTWLHDIAASRSAGLPPTGGDVPGRSVFQRVTLDAGDYVLSWADRAVDSNGVVAASETAPYRVSVVNAAGLTQVAFGSSAAAGDWSPRRSMSFSVQDPGEYRVMFGASSGERLGSVAVADVQLEKATSLASEPLAYQHTEAELASASNDCAVGDSLRKAFGRVCDAGRCWYELKTPITIDTVELESGFSRLAGKFATGNFNFRHVDAAVNIVGTGVIDCANAPNTDCYANSYLEYSLDHLAYDVTLYDHNGQGSSFNFGMGSIRNAKALATERVITQPISAADKGLLEQPAFTKRELSGRPISGAYRFRIFDRPGLAWNRIEDVQFLMHHRYWSRVQKDGSQ